MKKEFDLTVARVTPDPVGRIMVTLPENPFSFTTEDERKAISDPDGRWAKQGFKRWAAGGLLYVIKRGGRRYIPLTLRNENAASYAGHLTLMSGLSANEVEWLNPTNLIVREGLEEIVVMCGNRIVRPILTHRYEPILGAIYREQARKIARLFGQPETTFSPMAAIANFVRARNEREVIITSSGRRVVERAIVNFDNATNGVDLLRILEVELPTEGELRFVDCESNGDQLLDCPVILFDTGTAWLHRSDVGNITGISGAIAQYHTGVYQSPEMEKIFPITPVTATVLGSYL